MFGLDSGRLIIPLIIRSVCFHPIYLVDCRILKSITLSSYSTSGLFGAAALTFDALSKPF